MAVDIVDHVCEFPYLVVATLFQFLPTETAGVYCHCGDPLIRQLARARQWQYVVVNGSHNHMRSVPYRVLDRCVKEGVSPPYPIQLLTLTLRVGDTGVGRWRAYLEKHVAAVSLTVSNARWFLDEPDLANLSNLRGLTIENGLDMRVSELPMAELRFPAGLRAFLVRRLYENLSYRSLVIPESVTELELPFTSPEELPVFPSRLRKLRLLGVRAVDAGALVPLLPVCLGEFEVFRSGIRPPSILRSAAEHLPRLLYRHNLLVVDGDVAACAYMTQNDSGMWTLVLDEHTDYRRCRPQPVEWLEIRTELLEPSGYLRHLLPHFLGLKRLVLFNLTVSLCGDVEMPALEEVSVVSCHEVSKCNWLFVVGVTRLAITGCAIRNFPQVIRRCGRLEELDLSGNIAYVSGLDGLVFPASLRRLDLHGNGGTVKSVKRHKTEGPEKVGLEHLVHLEYLSLRDCKITELDRFDFPDGVVDMDLSKNPLGDTGGAGVQFPSSLRSLTLGWCGLKQLGFTFPGNLRSLIILGNLFAEVKLGDGRLPVLEELVMRSCEIRKLEQVVFPESLKKLDLQDNRFRTAKLDQVQLPPALEELHMQSCNLNAVQKLRFPQTLVVLDLGHNTFTKARMDKVQLPSLLRQLLMSCCKVKQVERLALPPALREWDLSYNALDGAGLALLALPATLESLTLTLAGIANPWVVRFPGALTTLVLTGNDLDPPPVGFVFPPGLEVLEVQRCGITDFASYRFPPLLRKLNVRQNPYPAFGGYDWPPCEVHINGVEVGARLDLVARCPDTLFVFR